MAGARPHRLAGRPGVPRTPAPIPDLDLPHASRWGSPIDHQFKVNGTTPGGLAGLKGMPLAGQGGVSGTNHVADMSWPTAAQTSWPGVRDRCTERSAHWATANSLAFRLFALAGQWQ
jgi:hypothetical protein